jgi:lambda repressor-like predicted transcriptional regulator
MTHTNTPDLLDTLRAENQALAVEYCRIREIYPLPLEETVAARKAWYANYRHIAALTQTRLMETDAHKTLTPVVCVKPVPFVERLRTAPRLVEKTRERHPKQDEICTLYREGWSQEKLRTEFGLSYSKIVNVLREGGVTMRTKSQSRANASDEEIKAKLKLGWKVTWVARALFCGRERVARIKEGMERDGS